MELSGKAKEKFEGWCIQYFKDNLKDYSDEEWVTSKEMLIQFYEGVTDSMRYGVYVDFFNSVGIEVFVKGFKFPVLDKKEYYFIITDDMMCHLNNHLLNRTKTRPEARTKAVEKANDLLNERL